MLTPFDRGLARMTRTRPAPDCLIEQPPNWTVDGLCWQFDPEWWYPEKGGSTREAKRVCNGGFPGAEPCPVRQQCLLYALANDERFGVWGGLSERERRRLNRPATQAGREQRQRSVVA